MNMRKFSGTNWMLWLALRHGLVILLFAFTCHANLVQYGDFQLSGDFPNLIINGDFATLDLTGWVIENEQGGDSVSAATGQCVIDYQTGDTLYASQFFAGASFTNQDMKFDVVAVSGGNFRVWTQRSSQTADYTATGTKNVSLVAATPNRVVSFAATTIGQTITVDNVFLRESTPWVFDNDWDLFTDGHATYISSSDSNQGQLEQSFTSVSGDIYKVSFTVTNLVFVNNNTFIRYGVGASDSIRVYENIAQVVYVIAGAINTQGLRVRPNNDIAGDTFDITNVIVTREFTTASNRSIAVFTAIVVDSGGVNEGSGPNGEFIKTGAVNDGKSVWDSVTQTANGLGSDVTWHIWYDTNQWVIGTTVDTVIAGDWTVTSASNDPSGLTYTPTGNSLGNAVTFNIGGVGDGSTRTRIRYSGGIDRR